MKIQGSKGRLLQHTQRAFDLTWVMAALGVDSASLAPSYRSMSPRFAVIIAISDLRPKPGVVARHATAIDACHFEARSEPR